MQTTLLISRCAALLALISAGCGEPSPHRSPAPAVGVAPSPSYLLAFYRAARPIGPAQIRAGTIKPESVELEREPFLSDRDFEKYGISIVSSNTLFTVTPEAAKRLWRMLGLGDGRYDFERSDEAFVVKALGEPVYIGLVLTQLHKGEQLGVPCLGWDGAPDLYTSDNVGLWIDFRPSNWSSQWLADPSGIPANDKPNPNYVPREKDPRGDPRIKEAVRRLFDKRSGAKPEPPAHTQRTAGD